MDSVTKDRLNSICPGLGITGISLGTMLDMAGLESNSLSGRPVQGLYEASAAQNHLIGARRQTADGRVFRYAKATNIVDDCKYGVKFWGLMSEGIATTLYQNQAVGDTTITIAAAGVSVDDYKGGYVMIHATGLFQNRYIVGNTITDSDGNITITLDGPLSEIMTTSHYTEVLKNPYANVQYRSGVVTAGDKYSSVAGIPTVRTTVANYFIWIQTWGPLFLNPHGGIGQDASMSTDERRVVFDWEGSIAIQEDCVGATDDHQLAGFVINRQTAAASGPPLIMLQISP